MVEEKGSHFQATFPDVFVADYQNPPLTGDVEATNKAWHSWKRSPFDWWQCQLNFAVWCATASCGVSHEDHLQSTDPPLHLSRLLHDLDVFWRSCALPSPEIPCTPGMITDMMTGPSNEFVVSSAHHWNRTGGRRWIMGVKALEATASTWSRQEPITTHTKPRDRSSIWWMPSTITTTSHAWITFILDNSNGFTKAGVERLNDSIQIYVWAILGAQAQMRSNIVKARTGFYTQKQFLPNNKDAIAYPVNILASMARYQKMLQYALTSLNFVFGIGLYLSQLHLRNIQGYDNEVIIAGSDTAISRNPDNPTAQSAGTVVLPAGTAHRGRRQMCRLQYRRNTCHWEQKWQLKQVAAHEEEKVAIVTAGIALGLAALWFQSSMLCKPVPSSHEKQVLPAKARAHSQGQGPKMLSEPIHSSWEHAEEPREEIANGIGQGCCNLPS